jgi:hypothetical protein
MTSFAGRAAISACALLMAATGVRGAYAQTSEDSGRPDLTGVWTNASLTGLTRPRGVSELVVGKDEAERIAAATPTAGIHPDEADMERYTDPDKGAPRKGSADFGVRGYNAFWVSPGDSLAKVNGEYRTSYIVDPADGQLPYENPGAVGKSRAASALRYRTGIGGNEGPEAASLAERCLIGFGGTGGPGMLSVLYNNTYRFVQTKDHLMILVEMVHDARIIPLFGSASEARRRHRPSAILPWLGDSVGWWEEDTLVVETMHVRAEQGQAGPFVLSPQGVVTESFSRDDGGGILYRFKVEDPANYEQPWTAELSFRPCKGRVFEYACHEGNYALQHILEGARLKENVAATTSARSSGAS